MGRSVMTHPDAMVVAYTSWEEEHVSFCQYCDKEVKHTYDGWVLAYENVEGPTFCNAHMAELASIYITPNEADAKHQGWDYDSDNFQNDVEATAEYMKELWPSLYDADRWVGNEVRVFLENSVAEVSVSEYCGLVALCIAPKEDEFGNTGLGKHWITQIEERFLSTFGAYARIGTFSNGESVYVKGDQS